MKKLSILFSAAFILLLTGCVQKRSEPYDYSALIESKPKSILVVMPTNSSRMLKAAQVCWQELRFHWQNWDIMSILWR